MVHRRLTVSQVCLGREPFFLEGRILTRNRSSYSTTPCSVKLTTYLEGMSLPVVGRRRPCLVLELNLDRLELLDGTAVGGSSVVPFITLHSRKKANLHVHTYLKLFCKLQPRMQNSIVEVLNVLRSTYTMYFLIPTNFPPWSFHDKYLNLFSLVECVCGGVRAWVCVCFEKSRLVNFKHKLTVKKTDFRHLIRY